MKIQPFASFSRSYPWKLHLLGLMPAIFLLVFLAISFGTGAEIAEYFLKYREGNESLNHVMKLITHLAGPLFYGIYGWVMVNAVMTENKPLIKFVLVYVLVELLITVLFLRFLKIGIGKPRPLALLAGHGYEPFSLDTNQHAFPSGHTTDITGSTLSFLKYRRSVFYSLLFGCIIALVAFSRIYLGMHHLADVAGGLFFGSLIAVMVNYLSTWEWRPPSQRAKHIHNS